MRLIYLYITIAILFVVTVLFTHWTCELQTARKTVFGQNFFNKLRMAAKAKKLADQETKNIIAGYCRESQQLLTSHHLNDTFYIIPLQIIHIILSYYFIFEQFVPFGNRHIKFSDDGRIIENPTANFDTAYGTFEIDCNDKINQNKIFMWMFYISNTAESCNSIGIDQTSRRFVNHSFRTRDGTYSLDLYEPVKAGDTIKMVFNVSQQTLKFYKCESKESKEKEIKAIQNIQTKDVKYVMAVYLWYRGKIELIDFTIRCCVY